MHYSSNNRQCRFQYHLVNSDFIRVTIPTSFKFTTLQPVLYSSLVSRDASMTILLIAFEDLKKKCNTVLTNMSVHDFLSAKATHILNWFRKRKIQFVNCKKYYLSFPRKRDYIKCYATINFKPQKGGREAGYTREIDLASFSQGGEFYIWVLPCGREDLFWAKAVPRGGEFDSGSSENIEFPWVCPPRPTLANLASRNELF